MTALDAHEGGEPSVEFAVILLDDSGNVRGWPAAAANLLGYSVEEVCGRPLSRLRDLADPTAGDPPTNRAVFRHRSGRRVELAVQEIGRSGSSDVVLLAAAAFEGGTRKHSSDLLDALLAQSLLGVVVHDADLNVVRANATQMPPGWTVPKPGMRIDQLLPPEDAREMTRRLSTVIETGVPLIAVQTVLHPPSGARIEHTLSVFAFRLEDDGGEPSGVAVLYTDTTQEQRARRRTEIGHEASARIGRSLDVIRTAQDIADVLVPALGDLASVEIMDGILEGEEPRRAHGPGDLHMRRVAATSADGNWPTGIIPVGSPVPQLPDEPEVRRIMRGDTVFKGTRREMLEIAGDPELIRTTIPGTAHSAVLAPLHARGILLGFMTVWRTERPEPFEQEDADLVFDIASRAALSVDNARRYTHEHRAAVALQQQLLPQATTTTSAAESAGCYVPAGGGADVGGDWFDAIPLPSLRMAFVVGDVVGHGLHAAATMGRLRAAIRTLAELELEPGELLIHLDDLVQQLGEEADPQHEDIIGATCLYAVYDPLTGTCAIASAGHPPPAVIEANGDLARLLKLSPGPPLGVGGMPFEATTVELETGSTLVLYTDGLIDRRTNDIDQATGHLLNTLSSLVREHTALDEIGRAAMAEVGESPPRDDMALLLARPRRLPPHATVEWQYADDLAMVAAARNAVTGRLHEWGLDDRVFTTELIVSELVTNAMRYAHGPIGLRLFHDDTTLVCEVSDSSSTQPHLRRAHADDEGGRGLYLVAQLSKRWGSRYHDTGKTIWAEQAIGGTTLQDGSHGRLGDF